MDKILEISCVNLAKGGVQTVIMDIVRGLHTDFQFDVVVFSNEEAYYEKEFKSFGGKIFRIPYYEGTSRFRKRLDFYIRFPRIYNALRKIIKNNGPYKAVHCHTNIENGICALAAHIEGVPIVVSHSHAGKPVGEKLNIVRRYYEKYLRNLMVRNSTNLVACSKVAGDYLFGDSPYKIVCNGIDGARFNISNYERSYDSTLRFSHVGRWLDSKNQLFLLDVFGLIHQSLTDSELKLVGFGSAQDEAIIKEYIEKLELEDCVSILPFDTDVPALFARTDYMIFPSIIEGFGIVLIEAQRMGVRCFASTGVPEETNIGLCRYIDLKKGPEYWAKTVLEDINTYNKKNRFCPELGRFNIDEINKVYYSIYSNSK